MKLSKNQLLSLLLLLGSFVGLGTWVIMDNPQTDTTQTLVQPTAEVKQTGRTEITYKARPGISSLEQLKTEASSVVTTESEYGALVDEIEGHKGGTDGYYWSFYVNGEMAQVGAEAYIQQEGDNILWKFQKL